MADNFREMVESGVPVLLSEAIYLSSDDGELKCLRFTKVNVLANIAKIISNCDR